MAEHSRQDREPVGSVAEETARLVEALGGWAEGLRAQHDDAAPRDSEPSARADTGAQQNARCEHCGTSSRAGEALACRLCPVCQGIALLRTVRPETVERLADVAAALSGALRDIAADRFGQPPPTPPPPPPRGQRVQDIVVDDEDAGEDKDADQGARPGTTRPGSTAPRSTAPRSTARSSTARSSTAPRSTAPTPASRTRQESTAP